MGYRIRESVETSALLGLLFEAKEANRVLFETTFGPVIALREMLAHEPERLASFDREFREFTIRGDHGSPGGPAEYPYRYLFVIAAC